MKYFFYPKRRFVTFAPIMNNNSKSPVSDLQYQQLLLRMEYEYEKEEFKRQTETMGIARKGEFYQFNLSSCIRQQNSLTAQFVSFSLSNLANIFYPPQFLQ